MGRLSHVSSGKLVLCGGGGKQPSLLISRVVKVIGYLVTISSTVLVFVGNRLAVVLLGTSGSYGVLCCCLEPWCQ